MKVAGQTNRTRFRKSILRPLLEAGLIEMTISIIQVQKDDEREITDFSAIVAVCPKPVTFIT
jgi:hypothetical protein